MDKALQKDVYNLRHPNCFINKVEYLDSNSFVSIRYVCFYWIDYLCKIKSSYDKTSFYDNNIINIFLKKQFFHWLEIPSFIKSILDSVTALAVIGLDSQHWAFSGQE